MAIYRGMTGKQVRITVRDEDGDVIDMAATTEPLVHLRDARRRTHEVTPEIDDGACVITLDDMIDRAGTYYLQVEFTLDGVRPRSTTFEFEVLGHFE